MGDVSRSRGCVVWCDGGGLTSQRDRKAVCFVLPYLTMKCDNSDVMFFFSSGHKSADDVSSFPTLCTLPFSIDRA